MVSKHFRSLLLVPLLGVALCGCQAQPSRSALAGADWSRGLRLGTASLNSRVGLAASSGGEAYLVWVVEDRDAGVDRLRFVRLDGQGRVSQERDLAVGSGHPSQVELATLPEGELLLTWLVRLQGGQRLLGARLDRSGEVLGDAQELSLPGIAAASYAVAPLPAGPIEVVWGANEGTDAGLYHTRLDRQGQLVASGEPLGLRGFDPALRVDAEGTAHLVWQEEPAPGERRIYYGVLEGPSHRISQPTEMATFPIGLGAGGYRPGLGLTTEDAYVFWSVERRGGGITGPVAESFYVTFPLGRPGEHTNPQRVVIPADSQLEYRWASSALGLYELALVDPRALPSQFVYMPDTSHGQSRELATCFSVQIDSRTKSIVQIVVAIWADGRIQGYQVAGKTQNTSLRPTLAGESPRLSLAWIETAGFGSFAVYYASTSPQTRAWANRFTVQDLLAAGADRLWILTQMLGFLPIVIAWGFLPLVLVAVYSVFRPESELVHAGPRIVLILAILLYAGFKYLFRPGWLAALPLPAWISPPMGTVLILAVPLLVSCLAGLATWLYARHREGASLWPALGIYVGCDVLMTLFIYVPGFLAE